MGHVVGRVRSEVEPRVVGWLAGRATVRVRADLFVPLRVGAVAAETDSDRREGAAVAAATGHARLRPRPGDTRVRNRGAWTPGHHVARPVRADHGVRVG